MNNLNIAIVILVVVILLYLSPATRSCVSRSAPWLALVGGGLAVGLLLMASPKPGVYGGASGQRRKGAAKRGAAKKSAAKRGAAKRGAAKKSAPKEGKRKGGAEHEALDDEVGAEHEAFDDEEEVDVTTEEEIEAFFDEDGDDAPDSLGVDLANAPEPSDEEGSSSDEEGSSSDEAGSSDDGE